VAEPRHRRLRRDVTCRTVSAQRIRPPRHGRQRLGVDGGRRRRLVASPMLRPAERWRAFPASRDQRRLASLRTELLPALPPGRATGRGCRHVDQPHRLSLRCPPL